MKTKMTFICLIGMLVILATVPIHAQQPFELPAAAGVLLDFDSGRVLFNQNGDEPRIPASLVKIMTMFVALDQISEGNVALTDMFTVSEAAWREGGSTMFLEVGERVSLEDLLFGIAVVSGNDATVAVAEALAGNRELFVQWMNNKADELGLSSLSFVDVHGLSNDNSGSALDLAQMARAYIQTHPEGLEYHQERSFAYQPRSQTEPIRQSNRNGLLWRYEGTDGLKTGFLSQAGYNLIATSEQDGRRLIAVVLGASDERSRENQAVELLNYGFRNFQLVELDDLLIEPQERVYKGQERTVRYVPQDDAVTIERGTRGDLEIDIRTEPVVAPVAVGDEIGQLRVLLDGNVIMETSLLAAEEVERGNFFRVIIDTIVLFFTNLFQNVIRR